MFYGSDSTCVGGNGVLFTDNMLSRRSADIHRQLGPSFETSVGEMVKNLLICLGSDDYFVRLQWLTISPRAQGLDCVLRSDSQTVAVETLCSAA